MLVEASEVDKIDFRWPFKTLLRKVFPEIRGHKKFPGKLNRLHTDLPRLSVIQWPLPNSGRSQEQRKEKRTAGPDKKELKKTKALKTELETLEPDPIYFQANFHIL